MFNYKCGYYHNWIRNIICHCKNDTEQFSFIISDRLFPIYRAWHCLIWKLEYFTHLFILSNFRICFFQLRWRIILQLSLLYFSLRGKKKKNTHLFLFHVFLDGVFWKTLVFLFVTPRRRYVGFIGKISTFAWESTLVALAVSLSQNGVLQCRTSASNLPLFSRARLFP